MASPLQVEPEDIERLNPTQLTELLKLLLHHEAARHGIFQRAINVALNINVPDGGEDGHIRWNDDGPPLTNFLPSRSVQFQIKASDMSATRCKNALLAPGSLTTVQPMVDSAFGQGAFYILFTRQQQNAQTQETNIAAMRQALDSCGKSYAATANILIYDAGKIATWVNNYCAAVVAVLNWIGRSPVHGLKTWVDWGRYDEYSTFQFVPDEHRSNAISQLRRHLSEARKCTRCIGLSGLGKTRLAYEVFNDPMFGIGIEKRVVYYDAAGDNAFHRSVTDWVTAGLEGILVVDNCVPELHEKLRKEVVQRTDSKFSLLTLDYNLDKPSETELIDLKPMPNECIEQMLRPVFGERIRDLPRIVDFAQGFPQIAVLLAQSRIKEDPNMGSLNDDVLAKKLLWGSETRNETEEKILEGCALFARFGIAENVEEEGKFIAERLVGVPFEDFFRCVRRFERRGLIDRRGRYAQLVPRPLAVRLAAKWWENNPSEIQSRLVDGTMPESLVSAFCEQISTLHFVPEAQALTASLCGPRGPFGQAKVILSEKGSRLFRAFADVNPMAVSNAVARVVHEMPRDDLGKIAGDVRRNLVATLERLAFHASCFSESAWSLLLLASAENETWSNNATGHFKQLFRTFLSGAEAPPEQRLIVLDRALADPRSEVQAIAVRALREIVAGQNGTRIIGAEYRGGAVPLQEWKPKVWKDAFDYWAEGTTRLVSVVIAGGNEKIEAKKAIADSIRPMMNYGRVDMLDTAIKRIAERDGPMWPDAVSAIRISIRYDSSSMPPEGTAKLHEWLEVLSPVSIPDKLSLFVTHATSEFGEDDAGEYIDLTLERIKELARELAQDIPALLPQLDALFDGDQRQAYAFGSELVQATNNPDVLIDASYNIIRIKERPNIQFLRGVLAGTFFINSERWHAEMQRIGNDVVLARHFNFILVTGQPNSRELEKSVDLIARGVESTSSIQAFNSGRPLEHLPTNEVSEFVRKLSEISGDAAWCALEVLFMYCHGSDQKQEDAREVFKTILLQLPLTHVDHQSQLAWHSWEVALNQILKAETTPIFAVALAKQIYAGSIEGLDYVTIKHHIQPVLRILFRKFGRDVWPVFEAELAQKERPGKFELATLLGSEDIFQKKLSPVLSELPDELLQAWCIQHPDYAPEFLASVTDAITESDGQARISPRAQFLLDSFGDNRNVLSALLTNLSTFSWNGSVVPYHERELSALLAIRNHERESVRNWANDRISYLQTEIEREKVRDQEKEWRIY